MEKIQFTKRSNFQDIIPARNSVFAMGKVRTLIYELLQHPPYSPDLAPLDFQPFQGQLSSSIIQTLDGILVPDHHWNKCDKLN